MNRTAPTDVIYLSRRDEMANTWTHAIACLLSFIAVGVLWRHPEANDWAQRASMVVFPLAMIAVYFCSTMSHWVHEPHWRNRWRAWDQGVIYGLIAATYTPFIWSCSPEGWRLGILVAVWLAAFVGFASKVLVRHRINGISTVTYILLGWLPAIPLARQTPTICLIWMVAGGLAYTLGILFLIRDTRRTFFHAAWHLMVMLGSLCHFIAVYQLPAVTEVS